MAQEEERESAVNAITCSSTTTDQQKKKTRAKRNTACHCCRKNHSSCDGLRPCGRCVRKKKQCFDYDPSLEARPRKGADLVTLSSTELMRLQQELEITREELKRSTSKIQELEGRSTYLVEQLKQQEVLQRIKQTSRIPLQNDIEWDLWSSTPNATPLIMYDRTNLRLVGCNEAFRSLSGFDVQTLRNCPVIDMIAEQFRKPWEEIVAWKLRTHVKSMSGCLLLKFKDYNCSIRVTCFNEANYIWTNLEILDYFCDEWRVNDVYLPATFKIPYHASMGALITTPASSFERLMDVIRALGERKVKIEDNADQSQDESSRSPPAVQTNPYEPPDTSRYSYYQVTRQPQNAALPLQALTPNDFAETKLPILDNATPYPPSDHHQEPLKVNVNDILELLSSYTPQARRQTHDIMTTRQNHQYQDGSSGLYHRSDQFKHY